MKIVVDKRIPGLMEELEGHDVTALEGKDITSADVRNAEALFIRTRTRCDAFLLKGSRVKLVGTATIGTDHIDMDWCRANDIRVVNAPGCNAPAVMQYVASSLHAAGFKPALHTLGVVGKGNIGSLLVSLYRESGCRVLVCDPPRKEAGCGDEDYLALEEVLERSDAVTFHVPYTDSGSHPTHHMLTPELLQRYPRPEILVNASRGHVFDPRILYENRRFIIDTWPFEDEPEKWTEEEKHQLVNKVFISTPHIAGYSFEGKKRATKAMGAALSEYLHPGTPVFCPGEVHPLSSSRYRLEDVLDSFNPLLISEALKTEPVAFELLRSTHLRHEPPALPVFKS